MGSRLRSISRLICFRCGCIAKLPRRASSSINNTMNEGTQISMDSHHIVTVFKQALATFSPKLLKSQQEFNAALDKLKAMMVPLRTKDVGLDETLLQIATWNEPDKAPCTYIELFENEHINMSIFILRPGFKMPLHDHPHMHGLLKVVSGSVNLRSFSKRDLAKEQESGMSSVIFEKPVNKHTFLAEVVANSLFNESSEPCVLTPNEANIHEIEALESPAAFLDILAPPYDTLIENNGPRRCNYYRVLQEIGRNLVQLEEIRPPSWFYCDQAPYVGPLLV